MLVRFMQTFLPGALGGSMRFCLAIVVGCALSSGAQAADLPAYPVRAPIYAAPAAFAAVYDWTGFYIGGNARGWRDPNRSVNFFPNGVLLAPIPAPPPPPPFPPPPPPPPRPLPLPPSS